DRWSERWGGAGGGGEAGQVGGGGGAGWARGPGSTVPRVSFVPGSPHCSRRGRRLLPPGAEDVDFFEDLLLLTAVAGGGQLGLELEHLLATVPAPFEFGPAFDHDPETLSWGGEITSSGAAPTAAPKLLWVPFYRGSLQWV